MDVNVLDLLNDREWLFNEYITKGKTMPRIANELGVPVWKVRKKIENFSFAIKKIKRHVCDESKFTYSDPVFCYYAGLVATDGYIDKNANRVSLRSNYDCSRIVFNKLIEYFKFSGVVHKYRDSYDLTIGSNKLVDELEDRFKILNNKTFTLEFPPKFYSYECAKMYFRGISDGDGSIKLSGDFRLYCASDSFIDGCINFLNMFFGFNIEKTYQTNKYPGFYICGKNAKLYLDWIYGGDKEFRFETKYARYIKIWLDKDIVRYL